MGRLEHFNERVDSLAKTIRNFLHLKETVDDVVRMNQNELADKPNVDKIAMQISEIKKGEICMESSEIAGQMLEGLKEKADVDKDGKVSFYEMINFFISNPVYIFLALAVISLNPIKDFLLVGITTNVWNWSQFLSTLLTTFTGIIFYFVTKSMDKNTQNVINSMKQQFEAKIENLQCELAASKSDNDNLKNANQGLTLSVELKRQEIELMSKKLV